MPQSVQISDEEFLDLHSSDSPGWWAACGGRLCVKENQPFLQVGLIEAWVKG